MAARIPALPNTHNQLPNVTLVGLDPGDPVAQEWHLSSPTYTAMVLCQELSAADYGAGGQPAAEPNASFMGCGRLNRR